MSYGGVLILDMELKQKLFKTSKKIILCKKSCGSLSYILHCINCNGLLLSFIMYLSYDKKV